jgi:DnaJ-class molecular chaperone
LKFHYFKDRFPDATDAEKKTAEENFKLIGEAYSILKEVDKREMYDIENGDEYCEPDVSTVGWIDFITKFATSLFEKNKSTLDILVNFVIFVYYMFAFFSTMFNYIFT